jgi:hypothetical protein
MRGSRTFDTEDSVRYLPFRREFPLHRPRSGLRQAARFAEKGVVIFDYFRRPGHEHRDGTRGTHADFCDALVRQGAFEIVSDEDLTEAITPTFVIHEHLKNEKIAPFVQRFRAALKVGISLAGLGAGEDVGRSLDKLGRKTGRAVSFGREHEYRLIVLKMTATG